MGFVLVLFLVTITTQKKLKIIKLFGIIFAAIAIHEIYFKYWPSNLLHSLGFWYFKYLWYP